MFSRTGSFWPTKWPAGEGSGPCGRKWNRATIATRRPTSAAPTIPFASPNSSSATGTSTAESTTIRTRRTVITAVSFSRSQKKKNFSFLLWLGRKLSFSSRSQRDAWTIGSHRLLLLLVSHWLIHFSLSIFLLPCDENLRWSRPVSVRPIPGLDFVYVLSVASINPTHVLPFDSVGTYISIIAAHVGHLLPVNRSSLKTFCCCFPVV